MDSSLENPVIRYGMGISSAVVIAVVAFLFLDGTMRWLALGIAAIEVVFVPQFLRLAAN